MKVEYEAVIGLEVHAQLLTDSKIFCSCNNSYGEEPNLSTCPVCQGLPGALPVLNKKAVEMAMRLITTVGGKISPRSSFARKNYFYPDLPKGYQITQYELPIGTGGSIQYKIEDNQIKKCRIKRIHLEEDAGKSIHSANNDNTTKIDLNRCGVPLVEIVSEPDIRTPESAGMYLRKLKQILQYLEICSGDMEKGHFRCDANISIRPKGSNELGTRTELKNLNSFKGVERALAHEIIRQTELTERGGATTQVTLQWNEAEQRTEPIRQKEESDDYRYFPEPDLKDLIISREWIEKITTNLPELPDDKLKRFIEKYEIRAYDAEILTSTRSMAGYFEKVVVGLKDKQTAANFINSEIIGYLNSENIEISGFNIPPESISKLLKKLENNEISGKITKLVLAEMIKTKKDPEQIISEQGLTQISDETRIGGIIESIISQNEENVSLYRGGKINIFDWFIGQVMIESGGKANPEIVRKILKKRLERK